MENLRKRQLDAVIREAVEKEIPFLGYALDFRCCLNKAKKRRGWKDLGF